MSCNPFAGLVESSSEQSSQLVNLNSIEAKQTDKINDIAEDIFYITINKGETTKKKKQLIYIEDLAETSSQTHFDLELLEQAVFERVLLENPENYIVPKTDPPNSTVCNKYVLRYLANCYSSLQNYSCDNHTKETIRNLIIRNFVLALKQPELFQGQELTVQLVEILSEDFFPHEEFFASVSVQIKSDDGSSLYEVFMPLLHEAFKDAARASLVNVNNYIYVCLDIFTCNEDYAHALLDFCTPANLEIGIGFANTLLGALLTLSVLPKNFRGRYEYFDKPLEQTSSIIESNLWTSTSVLSGNLCRIFLRLLKCSKTIKNRTLNWLAQCLKANAGRGKIWNTHTIDFNPAQFSSVSDGFMINLADVLLKLCLPFCSDISGGKILKVDPTYCAVPDSEREAKEVHMFQLSTETCLIPTSADGAETSTGSSNSRPISDSYNFVTECFFLAHRCLDLGYRVCVDQLVRMNQEIGQVQRSYNDAINQSVGSSDVLDTIKQRLEDIMTRYRSLRAVLLAPELLTALSKFHRATATWLTQVCINIRHHLDTTSYAPLHFRKVAFPLPETVPDTVKCIPEFVVENSVGFLSFLRRFHPQTLEEQGYEFLEPILTMVLMFMGSSHRMRNPHLRAKMAECLEALLPEHKDVPAEMNPLGQFQREKLFKHHPHRKEIVQNLLDVFVGIEMTGQSVQFEQKFNYRRPMYIVMDYLWQLEEHRNYFKELAIEAEENMEAVSPPLFLRFVNLLMNDAVFLLDESFSNMAQLRTMQAARESGEWDNLPQEERTQNLSYMQHIGMIARFDNILGRETIHTLELLTSEITIVFTHLTMVDRVAAMLNYFLYNLVGPNMKNFKVKDQKEYEFDPANTVMNICKIYVHLYESNAFCLAVSQDGRSYSPQLFSLAEVVLLRIGGGALISELQQVASKVAKLASQHQAEEEILTEAPEEFLDPIMSTLMSDPVILPSSKQTVDRNTIARHLLSDQTDPFNRSPLTMDQIIPNTELLIKINDWISSRRQKREQQT